MHVLVRVCGHVYIVYQICTCIHTHIIIILLLLVISVRWSLDVVGCNCHMYHMYALINLCMYLYHSKCRR